MIGVCRVRLKGLKRRPHPPQAEMREYSVLIGGQAGDGVRQAGQMVARIFNRLGYYVFGYDDYPSLIRGGHNFSLVRAAEKRVLNHNPEVDVIIALNKETVEKHAWRLNNNSLVIFDGKEQIGVEGSKVLAVPMSAEVRKRRYHPLTRNTYALGIMAGALQIPLEILKDVVRSMLRKHVEENLELAELGYEEGKNHAIRRVEKLDNDPRPVLTGNEAVALGAAKAGLRFYIGYPMTPASSLLHYLAAHEDELNVITVHPENEIGVAMMAIGAAYAGARTMVGTAGGGFALMVESLSLTGQNEIPVVFVVNQRPAPATGVPTYTAQSDLHFVLNAGHGEFPRVVVSPGDVDEAFYLAGKALNLAWKYQVPAIILSDKHLAESYMTATFDESRVKPEEPVLWKPNGEFKRYLDTETGVSPMAFPGTPGAIVKATSYEHDEYGITTEEPEVITKMVEKRMRKVKYIVEELKREETVKVYGEGETAIVTWGSTKGAVVEAAEKLGLKVIQPLYLEPFPTWAMEEALKGVKKLIDVEVNYGGALARLLKTYGIHVDAKILRYDGRPWTPHELEERLREVV